MRRKILILSLSSIVFFTLLMCFSVNFEADNITIFQIIYTAFFTLIVFSQSYIILKYDPALQKRIHKRRLLILTRIVILVSFGVFIYLFEYFAKLLWQDKLISIGLFLMLLPTTIMFVVLVLLDGLDGQIKRIILQWISNLWRLARDCDCRSLFFGKRKYDNYNEKFGSRAHKTKYKYSLFTWIITITSNMELVIILISQINY